MPVTPSPLRFPGGKTAYAKTVAFILDENNLLNSTFVEPFAGGAGVAITLLLKGKVKSIILNDLDPAIYAFWYSILKKTEDFLNFMHVTPITVDEWFTQRKIYRTKTINLLQLGFATFFLNRCNMSGILSANPIGGLAQKGSYKIDARFNKNKLDRKIRDIASRKDDIEIFNHDAITLVTILKQRNQKFFIYFDPPYYQKGKLLYSKYYSNDDHKKLSLCIQNCPFPWLLSYDNRPEIIELYKNFQFHVKELRYTILKSVKTQELIVSNLRIF